MKWLVFVEYWYNASYHTYSQTTLFKILYRWDPSHLVHYGHHTTLFSQVNSTRRIETECQRNSSRIFLELKKLWRGRLICTKGMCSVLWVIKYIWNYDPIESSLSLTKGMRSCTLVIQTIWSWGENRGGHISPAITPILSDPSSISRVATAMSYQGSWAFV